MARGLVTVAPTVLVASGLGSCVALALYERQLRLGGLAHIMLARQGSAQAGINPYQYADSALAALLAQLQERGAQRRRMVAKIAGGAHMFEFSEIGAQNVASIRQRLQDAGIPLVGADVGGSYGRSVEFHLGSGKLRVQRSGQSDIEI